MVVVAPKLFGGAKIGWQTPVTNFRGGDLKPFGNQFAFEAPLNDGQVRFVFQTYDAADNVAASIRAAKEWQ